jgi:hypothetical protein
MKKRSVSFFLAHPLPHPSLFLLSFCHLRFGTRRKEEKECWKKGLKVNKGGREDKWSHLRSLTSYEVETELSKDRNVPFQPIIFYLLTMTENTSETE